MSSFRTYSQILWTNKFTICNTSCTPLMQGQAKQKHLFCLYCTIRRTTVREFSECVRAVSTFILQCLLPRQEEWTTAVALCTKILCTNNLQSTKICAEVPGWWKVGESSFATALATSESWEDDCAARFAASALARAWDVLQHIAVIASYFSMKQVSNWKLGCTTFREKSGKQ